MVIIIVNIIFIIILIIINIIIVIIIIKIITVGAVLPWRSAGQDEVLIGVYGRLVLGQEEHCQQVGAVGQGEHVGQHAPEEQQQVAGGAAETAGQLEPGGDPHAAGGDIKVRFAM